MRFDTFNEVKKWYESTKPIISKNHTALDDIRPLNERRYKWERIVKLSDNKYAVVDGSWSPLTYNTQSAAERDFNNEVIEKMGTILWEKRDDGEYIHIRGCANGGYSISRYKLLDYYLPWTLRHVANTRQGGHWIIDSSAGTTPHKQYKLPKMKCRADWQNKTVTTYEDNSLTFKRIEDEHGRTVAWERIGEVTITGTTLNLERKKQLKPALNAFYQWLTAMQPLIPTDWESNRDFQSLMAEGLGIPSFWNGSNADQITPEFAEKVITDEDNQYRLAFAATLLRWIEVRACPNKHQDKYIWNREMGHTKVLEGQPYTEEETAAWYVKENKRIKAAYNRYMNKILGLFQQVTV